MDAVHSFIFLPFRQQDLQHLHRPFPDGNSGVVVNLPQVLMDFLQIVFQKPYDIFFFLLNHGNIHFQFLNQAVIGLYGRRELGKHLRGILRKLKHGFYRFLIKIFLKLLPARNLVQHVGKVIFGALPFLYKVVIIPYQLSLELSQPLSFHLRKVFFPFRFIPALEHAVLGKGGQVLVIVSHPLPDALSPAFQLFLLI